MRQVKLSAEQEYQLHKEVDLYIWVSVVEDKCAPSMLFNWVITKAANKGVDIVNMIPHLVKRIKERENVLTYDEAVSASYNDEQLAYRPAGTFDHWFSMPHICHPNKDNEYILESCLHSVTG